ncbi:MAG TPA: sulfotransferase [Anaerolineales bacterium]|nr:sulfotransferase [Anaerolineales bacterium]
MTLPNFMVIGVAKAGTTSLYHYFDQHPQVFMCPEKGSNFFGYEDARNWKWTDEGNPPLLRHFQARTFEEYEAFFAGVTDEIAIGEASPQYFRCPTAAQRIHDRLPHVKLIASLRNPADRAFSGFLMRTRRGEFVKGFDEELTPDASHVREGLYYKRLKRYLDLFPRDQIKIIIFEEFRKDPAKMMIELFDFAGVDKNFIPDTSIQHNPAGVPKIRLLNRLFFHPTVIRAAKAVFPQGVQERLKQVQQQNLKTPPKFPPELRAKLLDVYREDIYKVEELLGRDLSIWLNPT